MKLPDGFYKRLILLLLAILAAYFLSPLVFPAKINGKLSISDVLIKGPLINQKTEQVQVVIKCFFALLAAFATAKGYKYWQRVNHHKDVFPEITKYKEALNTISSLETKSDPPKFVKRKKRILKNRNKSARFSSKQARKIIDSSRSLSEFMAAE